MSDGVAVAKVLVLERERIVIRHRIIPREKVPEEVARFREAHQRAARSLTEIKEAMIGASSREPAFIIDAHLMMLEDDLLIEGVIELIESEMINAEWAIRKKVTELMAVFSRLSDEYLRERGKDVEQVAERVVRELVGKTEDNVNLGDGPVIVVARELTPAETAHMALENVVGFATEIGSPTSHAAIVAKSLRIPAVVGLKNLTREAGQGDVAVIDGHSGLIILNPSPETIDEYESRRKWLSELRLVLKRYKDLPAETEDGRRIKLAANLEILEELAFLPDSGAEGVGLYRTEFIYLDHKGLPSEEEQIENYERLIKAVHPHGATIRTLDIGGDKFKSDLTVTNEQNPAMGLRSIRLCLNRPSLFKTQLRAILRASASGKTRVMFPMISGHEEFLQARELLAESMDELDKEGRAFDRDLEVGLMIEVPSAAIIAPQLAKVADFFSIGTNDLIQYTLAIDRMNEHVTYLYEPLHPAVLRIIKSVVDAGHEAGIPVTMCGAMAADSASLPVLVGLGLDELSMPMGSMLMLKKILRGINGREARTLVEELFQYNLAREIRNRVKREIRTRWAEAYALELEAFEIETAAG